jgi:hypothetical protein
LSRACVSTVGVLVGDAWLALPRLIQRCAASETRLVCGSYALPVFEFGMQFIQGCDYEIEAVIQDPDDYANPYTPAWGAAAFTRAHGELLPKYPGLMRLDQCTAGLVDAPQYPLKPRFPLPNNGHVVLHPYTRHDWKNLSGLPYRLRFKSRVHLVGMPDEPEIPAAVDLRGMPYFHQALRTITARAVVSVASSFACLASVFQKRQLILSYTEDVSFWPHNPNAIKLAMPTQAEAQAVIDEEGF